jgi:hypothetical protein
MMNVMDLFLISPATAVPPLAPVRSHNEIEEEQKVDIRSEKPLPRERMVVDDVFSLTGGTSSSTARSKTRQSAGMREKKY